MQAVLYSLYAGLPVLLLHLGVTILIMVVGSALYMKITPHKELQLVKMGNVAAALSMAGTLLGFAIPLAFCLASSVNVYDIIVWGLVILVIQVVTFFVIDKILKNVSKSIVKQELAPVVVLVAVKLSIAVLSAAAIAG